MSFFQNAVLNKYLKTLNPLLVQQSYNKFTNYFHNPEIQNNIRDAKEEQFQEGFLRELFVNILGYTINPEPFFNLTTEFKNLTGAKKADGAILQDGKALAVVELKGTDTRDLDKISGQAFNYKNNQPDCVYVVTSNFEKIRFFIHNSVDHLEFNLFTLTENEFHLLWLCLSAESLLKGIPAKIKEESSIEEESITKYLYKDYASFRTDLWQNMVLNNPQVDQLILFRKTQKLLDRFLFIFFAEDGGLLPPNSIPRMVERWQVLKDEDAYKPLYDIFRQFFGYINSGRKGKTSNDDIFEFNGGLFLPDEILDTILIDDEVLQTHVMKLSTYDFQSEVDVNILGHIFENSLSEIENVKAQIEGMETDKSKSKRKKDGIFYTPRYITKYIVENTLGKLCEEKKAEYGIIDEEYAKGRKNRKKETLLKLDEQLQAYRQWLLNITICDPACGSGAFLNQALEFLIEEHQYLDELQAQLLGSSFIFPDVENHILEKNIFGVDINDESVEIARLSLWLRTAQRGRKLTSLNNNIKCGNSLIDDPAIAGDKAFKWQSEFQEVFARGGFDVVIGNPPYVNMVNIENANTRNFLQKNFYTAKNKCDLYSLFIEKSSEIANREALLGFIFPNSWLGTSSFSRFREFISCKTSIQAMVELPPGVFQDAIVTTVIMTMSNFPPNDDHNIALFSLADQTFIRRDYTIALKEIIKSPNFTYSFQPKFNLKDTGITLADIASFSLGIKTSDDSRFIFDNKKDEFCFPLLRGKNIGRYILSYNGEYIWYKPDLIKEKIGGRPRILNDFLKPKIVIQDIAKTINATFDNSNFLVNDTINVIHELKDGYTMHFILALLNSKAVNFWFKNSFSEGLHIKLNQLQEIPIPVVSILEQQPFIQKANLMLSLNKELQALSNKFSFFFSGQYNLTNLPGKLENWYDLEFPAFISELNKAIKTAKGNPLTKKDEFEWIDLFNENKQKALTLKSEIDKTDKEIDKMVYKLYQLTPEEIEIIEQKNILQ